MMQDGFRIPAWARGFFSALVAASLAGLGGLLAPAPQAETLAERTRGVRLLDPGDEMTPISPLPEVKPGFLGRAGPPLETVRIAVANGASGRLAALMQRAAPFEIVGLGDNPDLVWNDQMREVRAGSTIIAYDIEPGDLPAVIDRMAAVRGILRLAAERPQVIRLVSGAQPARAGERIEIEIPNVARQALVLFDIAGDGSVQALYPIGGDERTMQSASFRWRFQTRPPFGADLIVAVTAPQPMEALVQGLREISHYRSAGEVLKLLALAAPPDARIGALAISTVP